MNKDKLNYLLYKYLTKRNIIITCISLFVGIVFYIAFSFYQISERIAYVNSYVSDKNYTFYELRKDPFYDNNVYYYDFDDKNALSLTDIKIIHFLKLPVETKLNIAQYLIDRGYVNDADKLLDTVPDEGELLRKKFNIYNERLNKNDDAVFYNKKIQLLKKLIKIESNVPDHYYYMAKIKFEHADEDTRQKQYQDWIKDAEIAIEYMKKRGLYNDKYIDMKINCYKLICDILDSVKNMSAMDKIYALTDYIECKGFRDGLYNADMEYEYFKLADLCKQVNRPGDQINAYKSVILCNPLNDMAYWHIANVYEFFSPEFNGFLKMSTAVKEKSYSTCEEAINISKKYDLGIEFAGYIVMGDIDASLGNNKEAKLNYEKALDTLYNFNDGEFGVSYDSNIRKLIEKKQEKLIKQNQNN